jgi:hypothetical protein
VAEERLAALKKARRVGVSIVFIGEAGFRLQPVNRRTWASRGQTPMQRAWDGYDRLSVVSAVTLSQTRRQIDLPFQIHEENIRMAMAVAFVKPLCRQLGRPLIVVWDRWQVHRAVAKRMKKSRTKNIEFEWLPLTPLNSTRSRRSGVIRNTANWLISSPTILLSSSGRSDWR